MSARRAGAGQLDQRVTIQHRSRVKDGGGGSVETWVPLATVWAEQWPVGGRERAEAHQVQAAATVRFRVRRRADLTTDMRVTWNGRAYNVRHVADAGAREPFMVLDCESGVAI